MAIKTILVHLANDEGHRARLDMGRMLSRRFGAHLILLYVTLPASLPAGAHGRGASMAFIHGAQRHAEERAAEIQEEMEQTHIGPEVSWEFRIDNGDTDDLLIEYSYFCDLAIVGHPRSRDSDDFLLGHRTDDLLIRPPCPVIVVPDGKKVPDLTGNILVAWKASHQSARALRGALPFLIEAPKVYVLASRRKGGLETPGLIICDYLARHGCNIELLPEDKDHGEPGERILGHARDLDCSMIVMGAYSHSKLRNFVFGGTTGYLLDHQDRPILFDH